MNELNNNTLKRRRSCNHVDIDKKNMYLQFIYESVFTELVSFKFNLLNLNLNLF